MSKRSTAIFRKRIAMTKQIQITYPIQILPTINNPVLSRTCRKWPFISKVLDRLPSRILRKIYSDDYSVNERIIEHPFVHANLAGVSPGARILDVGSNYSPLVLELAGLGFNVTALDINESAFQHPNITFATGSICNTAFDNEAFDVVTAISTVEHIGLGYTGIAPPKTATSRRSEKSDASSKRAENSF